MAWDYLIRVMKLFNFCEYIINWIKIFLNDIKRTINHGGNISRWFKNRCGCRQGDTISPHVFLLCAEILTLKLRGRPNNKINGIRSGNIMHLISQAGDIKKILFS